MLVRFDLPFVGRMRLADVNDEEFDFIAIAAMERFEVPSLGTKRWSCVAAEDQRDGLASAKMRQLHALGAAEYRQIEVGRVRADGRRQGFTLGEKLHHRDAALGGIAATNAIMPPKSFSERFFRNSSMKVSRLIVAPQRCERPRASPKNLLDANQGFLLQRVPDFGDFPYGSRK